MQNIMLSGDYFLELFILGLQPFMAFFIDLDCDKKSDFA